MIVPTARDITSKVDPLDWYIEICAICGCQLGPGVGSRTRTGRCVVEEHRSTGGIVVRVQALPLSEQQSTSVSYMKRMKEPIPIAKSDRE
jgi:hypothetical protein